MRQRRSTTGIRRLVAIVLALVLMFAPMTTHVGMVSAAVRDAPQVFAPSGHCHALADRSADHGKSIGKTCCLSTGVAVAIDAASASREVPVQPAAPVFALTTFSSGFLGEIATPPPRGI
jgi:hypothetical protein